MVSLLMTVGISGSGKSTWAKSRYEELKSIGYKYVSSDEIREELFGDASCQDDNKRVFKVFNDRVAEYLNDGVSVIADATFLSRKDRRRLLSKVPKEIEKTAIVFATKRSKCIERDAQRDRTVGVENIDKQIRRFEMPLNSEFDDVFIKYSIYGGEDIREVLHHESRYKNITIDNPHHSKYDTVADHSHACFQHALHSHVPQRVAEALSVHDIGYLYTKSYDRAGVAHFYNHANVGAYWVLTHKNYYSEWQQDRCIDIVRLVNYHMLPFNMTFEQMCKKFPKDLQMCADLMLMNYIDKMNS